MTRTWRLLLVLPLMLMFRARSVGASEPAKSTLPPTSPIAEAQPTSGLLACTPGPTVLCLDRGRFQVTVTWQDFQQQTGLGEVVPAGADDSGLFWFFDSDNWEMLVKIIDGCALNQRFWVFAAATTNVAYTLSVADTVTGTTRSYQNLLGTSAPAITDTSAFATCDASARTDGAPATRHQAPVESARDRLVRAEHLQTFVSQATCSAGRNEMCLAGGRFKVAVNWKDFQGNSGQGQVVPLASDDSGLFWFFYPSDWEMLVKIVNGCDLNQQFWVFAAATTNVQYELQVTDTFTGEVKTYDNALGTSAAAVTDTSA